MNGNTIPKTFDERIAALQAAATTSAELQSVNAYKGGMFKIAMSDMKAATQAMQSVAQAV